MCFSCLFPTIHPLLQDPFRTPNISLLIPSQIVLSALKNSLRKDSHQKGLESVGVEGLSPAWREAEKTRGRLYKAHITRRLNSTPHRRDSMNLGLQGSCKWVPEETLAPKPKEQRRKTTNFNFFTHVNTYIWVVWGGRWGREGRERRRGKGKRKENFKNADHVWSLKNFH